MLQYGTVASLLQYSFYIIAQCAILLHLPIYMAFSDLAWYGTLKHIIMIHSVNTNLVR